MALIAKNTSIDKINVFVFDHIYKCAGSTVGNILSQSPSFFLCQRVYTGDVHL